MSYVKQQWVDGQTKVDAAHLNHIEQGIADVESAIPDVSQFVTKDDTYTKEQIDAKISSVMSYKGTVATVEDLPSSATVGDVYNVTDTGMNYAWNGSQWDALGSDIDLSDYVTNTQFETELAKKQPAGDYATVEQLNTQLAEKQPVGDYATTQELNVGLATKQEVGDYPVYQKFSAGADPAERKTIQLANADSISGISTTGDGANLIMMSKWDKVDIGSTKYQMNLNSPSGVVQINDEKVVATTDQIPDVSNFATNTSVDEKISSINEQLANKQDKGDYATNEVVQAEFESYDKTIKAYVDSKLTAVYTYKGSVANEQALPAQDQTVGDVYNVEDTGKNVAWDGEKWDELGATVDLSAYAKKSDLDSINQAVTKAQSDVDNIGNVVIPQMNTNTAKALDSKVQWDEQKKVISLPVDGSISAMREADPEEGTQPEGGVLLAQRTYDEGATLVTEVGTTKNKLTLNASERPQVDIAGGSSEKLAYQSELPVLIKLPVRNGIGGFQDKLYTQEEIFAWFGVTDLSGFLALAKSTCQVWISYVVGASFQTSAYRYLANYIEYVPDSQAITVIWVGPDSANADVISKFVFKANLDQTVIAGASNVQLTVTSIE